MKYLVYLHLHVTTENFEHANVLLHFDPITLNSQRVLQVNIFGEYKFGNPCSTCK